MGGDQARDFPNPGRGRESWEWAIAVVGGARRREQFLRERRRERERRRVKESKGRAEIFNPGRGSGHADWLARKKLGVGDDGRNWRTGRGND